MVLLSASVASFFAVIYVLIIVAVALVIKNLFQKKPSPIRMILFPAVLGMLLYGI